jgi:hypothetical protein
MTCNGHTSMHDGLSPARFFYNGRTGRQTTVLCRGCAHVIEAMGSGWTRDRRSDPTRPDRDYPLRAGRDANPPSLSPALSRSPRTPAGARTPARLTATG